MPRFWSACRQGGHLSPRSRSRSRV
jgi:hypothetical protein